jgi:hypothetical protein
MRGLLDDGDYGPVRGGLSIRPCGGSLLVESGGGNQFKIGNLKRKIQEKAGPRIHTNSHELENGDQFKM